MSKEIGLNCLKPGESAYVSGLSVTDGLRRRLQDMGLVSGARVECIGVSPLGDPTSYLIQGAVVALRRKTAREVMIADVAAEVREEAPSMAAASCENR